MNGENMNDINAVLAHVDANVEASVARLAEIVRIPSISADPAYAGKCREAGEWVVRTLSGMGCEASLRETGGQPMVVAHTPPLHERPTQHSPLEVHAYPVDLQPGGVEQTYSLHDNPEQHSLLDVQV